MSIKISSDTSWDRTTTHRFVAQHINHCATVVPRITKLLSANHLIMSNRTKFDTEQKSLKLLLGIMTLVSSANNNCYDTSFISGEGHLYTYYEQ